VETFKSLPLAEVRQIINHKIDLQFTEFGDNGKKHATGSVV